MSRKIVVMMAAVIASSSCSLADAVMGLSVLDEMTEEKMCALVENDTVEQALDMRVESPQGGRAPGRTQSLAYDCKYYPHKDNEGTPWQISTELGGTLSQETDQEALDGEFTDLRAQYAEPGDAVVPYVYQKIADLGTLAGYGEIPLFGHRLAVVFTVGDERLVVSVSTRNAVRAEQLTPVAEELIANLQL